MGQIWGNLLKTFKAKIPQDKLDEVSDKIFDRLVERAKEIEKNAQPQPEAAPLPCQPEAEAAPPSSVPDCPIAEGEAVAPQKSSSEVVAVAEKVSAEPEKPKLSFGQMHEAIVAVFEELNKVFPRANYKPPTEEEVYEMLKPYDDNEDKHIDRKEFRKFVGNFTVDLARIYAKDVLLVTVAVPAAALVTKTASRRVPFVGNLLARIPTTVFVATVTSAVVIIQNMFKK